MAPQFLALKTSGEFSVGDACQIFQCPSPQFTNLCKRLAESRKCSDFIRDFIRNMSTCTGICILFTVGPIFNKLFILESPPPSNPPLHRPVFQSQPGPPSNSKVPLIRKCAIRLAQAKARMLKLWISDVQPKVNPRSRDWIRALERSVLLANLLPAAESVGAGCSFVRYSFDEMMICLKMTHGENLRWARCTTEGVAAISKRLAPLNRERMCTTEYSPEKLNGQRSAYLSLLSSQKLPEHECVEVTLREPVAAHGRTISSLPLDSSSPEERSRTLDRSLQGIYPGCTLDRL
jgi:hypothetical protein